MEMNIANPQTSFIDDLKANSEEVSMTKKVNCHGVGQLAVSIVVLIWTVSTTSFFIEGASARGCKLP